MAKGTIAIELPKRVTLRLSTLEAALAKAEVKPNTELLLAETVQLELTGVSCEGCAGHVKDTLGGLEEVSSVEAKALGEGRGLVRVVLKEGRSVGFASLKNKLPAKFAVADIIWDARCGSCTGFGAAKKAGCGGCGEKE